MHLLTQPTLGTDAEAVAYDQHADHQFWINRGPPDLAIERPQVGPQAGQVDEAVDRTQKVGGAQLIHLRVMDLIVRRDAGVADEPFR